MAKPTLYGEPASAAIRVRVTPTQRRDLERVARANHTDLAGVIREAVNEYATDCGARRPFVVHNDKPPSE
jgi:hypothetical protein